MTMYSDSISFGRVVGRQAANNWPMGQWCIDTRGVNAAAN